MSIKKKIALFWKTFMREQEDLEKALDQKDHNEIKRIQAALNDCMIQCAGCYMSVHKEESDFYECTFLPEEDKTSQLICVMMKQFTPASVNEKWLVHEHRPPMSERVYHMTFDVKDLSYTIFDMDVALTAHKEFNAFDLHVVCDGFEWMSEPEIKATVDRVLKHVLGDVLVENNVNEVTFSHIKEKDKTYVSMSECYEVMVEKMDELDIPLYRDCTQTYRIFRRNEAECSDEFLADRLLISTLHPTLFIETMEKERVILDQMTRLGGEYGVMAYEITTYDEAAANHKRLLEKQVNELLVSCGTARLIGSAIGKKHIYFDVAVFDKADFKTTLLTLAKNNFMFTYRPY